MAAALKVNLTDVKRLKSLAENAHKRAASYKGKAEKAVDGVVETVVGTASAFALGAIDGYTDGVEVLGIGLPLIVAGGAHVGGMLMGGKAAPHLHAAGNGALAYYAGTLGRKVGTDMRSKVDGTRTTTAGEGNVGALPDSAHAGETLTAEELRVIAEGKV